MRVKLSAFGRHLGLLQEGVFVLHPHRKHPAARSQTFACTCHVEALLLWQTDVGVGVGGGSWSAADVKGALFRAITIV